MARLRDPDPETAQRRLAEIADVEASRRTILPRFVAGVVVSVVVALAVMAWGFSLDDADLGPTIFFSGALLGNLGIVLTLLWAYRAREG